MGFARTEEQDALAEVVRSLLDKHSDPAAVRAAMAADPDPASPLWRALIEVGATALPIPEQYDGAGASLVETGVVLEELGRNLGPTPLLATALSTAALLLWADEGTRAELLPRIAGGEPAAVVLDDGPVLDGTAPILLRASGDDLELLEDAEVGPVGGLDQTLRFARVRGGTPRRVGQVDERAALPAVAAALATALQVGAAQRGLEMTVAYSKEREQFGRPIGSFQALKHRMADMLVLVEASRSASWGAVAAAAAYVATPDARRLAQLTRLAAVARSYCSDALDHVAAETVQLHGGIAITWEHDAQLVFKRAHALAQLFGPAHAHRASLLPGLSTAGQAGTA